MTGAAPDPLQAIRNRIDRIDETIHRLLIDRSGVIAELIRIKGTSRPATAFRPDREADMMRRIVARHEGDLPLVTVEHIWREIITTFTAMQAPFRIVAGPAADPLAMRDLLRFYFGFSIDIAECASNEAAIERASGPSGEIAVIALDRTGAWWDGLSEPASPKVFAKLPFLDVPVRPAALPAYVIGPALRDAAPPDIRLYAAPVDAVCETAIHDHDGRIVARAAGSLLVELPVAVTWEDLSSAAAGPAGAARILGGFAQPIRLLAERTR